MSKVDREALEVLMERVLATFPPEIMAAVPGACTAELSERLKAVPKKEWVAIFEDHADKRAAEACHMYRDGDLLYRTGDFIAGMYSIEFDGALKLAGHLRRKRPFLDPAYAAFAKAVDAIRARRLGPLDQLHLINEDDLEWSPPMFEKHDPEAEA